MLTAPEVLSSRLSEATKVRQAYDVQVARHRAAWRSASPAVADKARRRLVLALEQQAAAKRNERDAEVALYG